MYYKCEELHVSKVWPQNDACERLKVDKNFPKCREELGRNKTGSHRFIEKALNIKYSLCVFAALGIQHAMCMRHIFICDIFASTIFFHIIS